MSGTKLKPRLEKLETLFNDVDKKFSLDDIAAELNMARANVKLLLNVFEARVFRLQKETMSNKRARYFKKVG